MSISQYYWIEIKLALLIAAFPLIFLNFVDILIISLYFEPIWCHSSIKKKFCFFPLYLAVTKDQISW